MQVTILPTYPLGLGTADVHRYTTARTRTMPQNLMISRGRICVIQLVENYSTVQLRARIASLHLVNIVHRTNKPFKYFEMAHTHTHFTR